MCDSAMDPIVPVENSQDMDTDWGQVITNCIGIPLILREILECFSTTELIQLSLVNKQWNYEARSLMKMRGNLTASINKDQTCQHLTTFASDLRRMKEIKKLVPFSGMTISLSWFSCELNHWCQLSPERELQTLYEEILDGMTWKHLSVRILLRWEDLKYCVAFILVKKILENFAPVLEEFSIQIESDATKHFMRECLQNCSFSRLKTFRLLDEPDLHGEAANSNDTELTKTVVSRAPNLQVFYSTGEVDLLGNLLKGSSAVHVTGYHYSPSRDEIPESVASKLRVSGMELFLFSSNFSLQRFNRITSMLLQSSQATLSTIGIDVVFLAPLMLYGVCLENVRKFSMSVDHLSVKKSHHIWRLVKSFDFTRIFPTLDTVKIICDRYPNNRIPDEFNEMIEQLNAVAKEPAPDRAANIKRLKLEYLPDRILSRRSSFRLLAHMFPHVQKLEIQAFTFPFAHIGDIWVDLKQVDVKLHCPKSNPINLDSSFCGIFPEEAAHLREEDEEYLRSVNIVPVMPSIAYLKELRTFTVSYNWDLGLAEEPTRLPSKVSALIAFQRCPNLTVNLTAENERQEQALSHLKPYAAVLLKNYASV